MSLFEKEFDKYQWVSLPYPSERGIAFLRNNPHHLIPNEHGTYIIRAASPLNRVRGSSNVVYIGQYGGEGGGEQGIHQRLFNTGGVERLIRREIEKLFPHQSFQLQYSLAKLNGLSAKTLETKLLAAYLNTHLELPPANHQCPKGFAF